MRLPLVIGSILLFVGSVMATHLVGGELYYTSLGNDQYELTLKMYRDCGPNNENGTGFDASVTIVAYNENNVQVASGTYFLSSSVNVPVSLNNPCLTPPETICVEEGVYTGTMFLPSGAGTYTLSYQRCCRPPIVTNLAFPGTQGLTCTVTVPDPNVTGANSSPRFTEYPPIALCMGQPMGFSYAATDPEGDELVYSLCAPLQGGSDFDPIPSPPAPPPFQEVNWAMGYSLANMMDANPPLFIDAVTGYMTFTPTLIGFFNVGVRVQEFRNGVMLSEVIRDVRFDVVPCVQSVISTIADQSAATLCAGLTIAFENNSDNGDFYHWDFGVAGTLADTSNAVEPTFEFPAPGTYTVTLVANPGTPCSDTSTNTFAVSPPVTVQFARPPIRCVDEQPFTLVATGDFSPAASVVWNIGAGSAMDIDEHQVQPSFPGLGAFPVSVTATEFNCTGTYQDSVIIHPRPVPLFVSDTAGCTPLPVQFMNSSTSWTPLRYLWDFGDGTTSTEEQPLHLYTTEGAKTVSLTIYSDSGCVATESLVREDLIRLWPQPIAGFDVDPLVADLMDPVIHVQDISTDAYDVTFTLDGQQFDTTAFQYTFQDAGWFTITLEAVSGLGCSQTISKPVFVGGHFFYAPTAFSPDGDGNNETWKPSVKGARKYKLDIFDRWGNVVFHSEDIDEAWEARDAPIGTYAYKAWLTEWGPLEKEYNGSITLIR